MNTDAEILDAFVAKLPTCSHATCERKATGIVLGARVCDEHGALMSNANMFCPIKPLDWAREIRAYEKLRGRT